MIINLKKLPANSVYTSMESPVGTLWLVASKEGLHAVLFDKSLKDKRTRKLLMSLKRKDNDAVLRAARKQLAEYFKGKRMTFDLPLVMKGTDFQMKAWTGLMKIPFGATASYLEQAAMISENGKARAVGAANGQNALSIVVPCHRVFSASGALTGFTGGLDAKKYLLEHEKAVYAGL